MDFTQNLNDRKILKFPHRFFNRTVITDFNIVCGDTHLKTISTTVYMSGMLFGSLVFGWISDALGRRSAFGCAVLTTSVSATVTAFSANYFMFMVFRFLTCMGGVGCFLIPFVWVTEFVGTNYRTLVGIIIEIPFALGELYLVMLAYFIRDWQVLQVSGATTQCGNLRFFLPLRFYGTFGNFGVSIGVILTFLAA